MMTLCPCECQMGGGVFSISPNICLCAAPFRFLWLHVTKIKVKAFTPSAKCTKHAGLHGKPTTMYICSSQSRPQEVRPLEDTVTHLHRTKPKELECALLELCLLRKDIVFNTLWMDEIAFSLSTTALFCLHNRGSYFNSTQESVCLL